MSPDDHSLGVRSPVSQKRFGPSVSDTYSTGVMLTSATAGGALFSFRSVSDTHSRSFTRIAAQLCFSTAHQPDQQTRGLHYSRYILFVNHINQVQGTNHISLNIPRTIHALVEFLSGRCQCPYGAPAVINALGKPCYPYRSTPPKGLHTPGLVQCSSP